MVRILCSSWFSEIIIKRFCARVWLLGKKKHKEAVHADHQQSASKSFLGTSTVCCDNYIHSVLLTYFVDGVWFSAGEYGTGYRHIGTNASLLWSWSLLFCSWVSNMLWVRDNLLLDGSHVISPAQAATVMCLSSPAHPQMLSVRCRSTRVLSPCTMPRWTPMCTTTSTWSCSEPRGTSTYLASLSSSGC